MEDYSLPNAEGGRTEFAGVLLSRKDSKRPESLRWTEISIYRTQAGKYIVHKVGRTVVVHRPDRGCTSGRSTRNGVRTEDLRACPKCRPDGDLSDEGWIFEQDRNTVHVSGTAEGAVESAHTQDDDGTTYLTYPARQALREASERDVSIAEAFLVQRVD